MTEMTKIFELTATQVSNLLHVLFGDMTVDQTQYPFCRHNSNMKIEIADHTEPNQTMLKPTDKVCFGSSFQCKTITMLLKMFKIVICFKINSKFWG